MDRTFDKLVMMEALREESQVKNSNLELKNKQLKEIIKILIEHVPKHVLDKVVDKLAEVS